MAFSVAFYNGDKNPQPYPGSSSLNKVEVSNRVSCMPEGSCNLITLLQGACLASLIFIAPFEMYFAEAARILSFPTLKAKRTGPDVLEPTSILSMYSAWLLSINSSDAFPASSIIPLPVGVSQDKEVFSSIVSR